MKRFRFALRPVAVLRAHREVRAKEVFAHAVQAYEKTQADLAQKRAQVAGIEAALSAGRQGSFSAVEESQALFAYRQECKAEAESEQTMLAARGGLEQRRAEYLAARRQLEVVHRLEEKARSRHREEAAREEQAESDDFATRRATRLTPLKS
jgi:flagellar export protein FliJ